MKKFSILAATLLASSLVMGQSKVSPYTVHRLHSQHTETRSLSSATEYASAYLHTQGETDMAALEALGVKVTLRFDGILTARIPLDRVEEIAALDFIRYVEVGTPVRQMLDKARSAANVDKVHGGEALDMPLTGKGVVVGIIDGGFDYTHPAFYDEETGALRIKRVWEQGTTEGTAPEAFGYGVELATAEAIQTAGADVNNQSHGSHVAAIAAGANRKEDNAYYGIAPDADIVLVSKGPVTANSANISDAISYICDYAASVGKPCVVNMSLGWNQGPHDGTSTFDRVADQLQGEGRLLVGSMGNYGNDPVHISKTFTGSGDTPLKTMVAYKIAPSASNVGGEVDIWGDAGMAFDLQVVVVRNTSGSEVAAFDVMDVALAEGATREFTLSNRISGKVTVTTEINPLNGKPHAFVSLGVESRSMGMTIGLVITPRSAGTVHAWADATYTTFEEEVPDGWTPGDKQYTLCEIGGTGKRIISVGAYVSSDSYVELGTSQTKKTDEVLGTLATFSSIGPTMDGRMKPDVIAPGTFIASAVNSYDIYKTSYPTASAVAFGGNTYNYSYMQGTSMAAPFVTGVLATWLQANPALTPEDVRTVLSRTAMNDEHTQPSTCGYGKIDAYAGLAEVLAMADGIDGAEVDVRQSDAVIVGGPTGGISLLFTRDLPLADVELYDVAGIRHYARKLSAVSAGQTLVLPADAHLRGICFLRVNGRTMKVTN